MNRREFVASTGLAVLGHVAGPAAALAQSTELADLSMAQAIARIRRKGPSGVSPVDLVQACLTRITKHNDALHAYITVTGEQALADARAMEAEARRGQFRGPLHGVPIALKDNIDTAGGAHAGCSRSACPPATPTSRGG